jgi:hypothetical protein
MFRKSIFRNISRGSRIRIVATLWAALTLGPCTMFAQHGGHGAGGSIGGGGMNGGGRPTGVDQKDDLKDFHQALAVQATSQQIIAYASMMKSTSAATVELQALLEQLGKQEIASALAVRDTTLQQAIEKARTDNKNFIGGFSSPQKSGLKETAKKLTKADSELAQRSQELNQRVADPRVASEVIASAAQSVEHALTSFQDQQASLGREMSILTPDSEGLTFNIAPVRNSISFRNQPVAIITSGMISQSAEEARQNVFTVKLTEDIFDLQQNITEVLRAQLDKSDRCGERIAIQDATLTPLQPASLVVTRLHFERWACFGGQNNEIAEGDGTLEVKLTPAVEQNGRLQLTPAISRVDAEGLLGESLRSGSLGSELRDQIAENILSAVRQGGDFKLILPAAAQGSATLHRAQFQSTGAGALTVVLEGDIRVSNDKATSLASELKKLSPQPTSSQQTMPR